MGEEEGQKRRMGAGRAGRSEGGRECEKEREAQLDV